jgi:hypothetical protein
MKHATWLLNFVPSRICNVDCPIEMLVGYGVGIIACVGRWAVAGYPGHHIVLIAG